ncbi:lactonase family protein [Cohnella thermotolerans]|uniref:lactonase family protein n=1 Tax=Cohnella thermotolerans TaxID=329858 RepID=UPI0004230B84|nr:lactonase family protein [Cohnella thermotolerans]
MRPQEGKSIFIFAGTYDSADREAIHLFKLNGETGEWSRSGGIAGIENPSFVAAHPHRNWLYAVSETEAGAVVAFRYDLDKGELIELGRQPSEGDAPCHLHVDRTGRWLLAVNYTSGSVCLYPIREDGAVGPLADHIRHEGKGPREDRQERAHAHSIFPIPNSDDWIVCDLGTDGLYVYRLDAERGKLVLRSITRTEPGAGPRHVAFHPTLSLVYVVEELACAVSAYRYDVAEGQPFERLQTVPTLPDDYKGDNTCADIHLTASGEYLYASNRGHDSLAVYRVLADGLLRPTGHAPTLGRTPRNFAVIGDRWLLAANQDTDTVVTFRLNEEGFPIPAGHSASVVKPVCLQAVIR